MDILRMGLVLVLVLGAACGSGTDDEVSSDATNTTACEGADCAVSTVPGAAPGPGEPGEPEVVEPIGDAISVRTHDWDELLEGDDEDDRTFLVAFWSGVEPCHVVDRIEVEETADRVTVTLYTGAAPGSEDTACIEIAVRKAVRIELDEPLGDRTVVDGAEAPGG